MPALVTNSKIWGEMFGTKEMHLLFSDEGTTQLYLDVEAALARSQSKLNIIPKEAGEKISQACLLYTSPSPRDRTRSRMPSSA